MAAPLDAVLALYDFTPHARVTPLAGGLINQTYRVDEADRRAVLQRLHPVFGPSVHHDIEAITAHIADKGLCTPRLLRTRTGDLYTQDADGHVYRMLSFLTGRTVQAVERPETAYEAARLVARFHVAVRDLEHTFHFTRPGVHDTAAHAAQLARALTECAGHRAYDEIAPEADALLARIAQLSPLPWLPARTAHGDLKIANVLFEESGDEAKALLDLDTMGHLTIAHELGDAFRSWCNPAGEDLGATTFSASIFEAAIAGYAREAGGLLLPEEVASLVLGAETIALELSARFCADALYERYFGWNPAQFPSRSAHNLARARGQHRVADAIATQRGALEAVVAAHFVR